MLVIWLVEVLVLRTGFLSKKKIEELTKNLKILVLLTKEPETIFEIDKYFFTKRLNGLLKPTQTSLSNNSWKFHNFSFLKSFEIFKNKRITSNSFKKLFNISWITFVKRNGAASKFYDILSHDNLLHSTKKRFEIEILTINFFVNLFVHLNEKMMIIFLN